MSVSPCRRVLKSESTSYEVVAVIGGRECAWATKRAVLRSSRNSPMTIPTSSERYALSFTTGGLLARESDVASQLFLCGLSWAEVRSKLIEDNLLQSRTFSTRVRTAREVVQRLSVLADAEIELLQDGSPSERGYILWVAACRRYTFIGEFAEEVVRERFLLMTPTLSDEDFQRFLTGKSLWHPELDQLRSSTRHKLRQTLFRMLFEAGLKTAGDRIVPTMFSARVIEVLERRNPSDLRFFPTTTAKNEVQQ